MALAVPTAEPCVECGTRFGPLHGNRYRPARVRGLCWHCYDRNNQRAAYSTDTEKFEGFPEGYTHEPTGWPIVPALVAPLHPTLPAPSRWRTVIWFRRPQHDPVGQRLFDAETRYDEAQAA